MIKTYAEVSYPGTFFAETTSHAVEDPDNFKCPDNAYGYQFYQREEMVSPDTGRLLTSTRFDHTDMVYPDATFFSLQALRAEYPELTTLISNVEGNGWKGAVRTRQGNWQPWEKEK